MKYRNIKRELLTESLNVLFEKKRETMLVNQIISGNVFMTAEENHPIKIKDLDFLSNKEKLQNLIWNRNVEVEKLYIDKNNCIVSEVFLNDQPLKKII